MKTFFGILITVVLFLVFHIPVFAARNLSISSNKTSLFGNEDMIVTASASGFMSGEVIYIKGAFYQEGSTNYFGYAKKDDEWIKNGDSTLSQKSVKIGEWDKLITVKSDFLDSGYKGEGDYKLKLGFYYLTTSGNLSSVNWSSNSLDINLNEPDPTPVPTEVPVSTNVPTNIPTGVPTAKPTLTIKPTAKITPIITVKQKDNKDKKEVILKDKDKKNKPSPVPTISGKTAVLGASFSSNLIAKVFIGVGAILLITCAILAFRSYKNRSIEIK